jgi:hypothetical protein
VNSLKPLLSIAALAGMTLAIAAPAAATPQRELRETRCDLLEQNRGRLLTIEAPDLHVLAQTANGQRFAPAIPQGMAGVSCGRSSVIPAAWDDQVLALGLPLFIAEDSSRGRVGVLEIDSGRYRFRLIRGEAQAGEQAEIDARIQSYQARFDAAQRQPRRQ